LSDAIPPGPPAPEFHGLRDFFAFIKAVCQPKLTKGTACQNNELAAHRNFGGSIDPEVVTKPTGLSTYSTALGLCAGVVLVHLDCVPVSAIESPKTDNTGELVAPCS